MHSPSAFRRQEKSSPPLRAPCSVPAQESVPNALRQFGIDFENGFNADDIDAANIESDDDSSDDEDETAALMQELERIKKEREEAAAKKEAESKARSDAERKDAMLRGNPLLGDGGFGVKRRWDDDVVFRNQARTEPAQKKAFINDTIRNDFHKKFINKYVK